MPLALFLISVIVSGSMFVTLDRVSRDTVMNQALVESTAAFYTASSSAEVSWSKVTSEKSTERIETFDSASTDKVEGVQGSQAYLAGVSMGTDDFGAVQNLEFNQGRVAGARFTGIKIAEQSFVDSYMQSSAEVFLYDVAPNRKVDFIQVDYCADGEGCPELIVDWFVFQDSFHFQKVDQVKLEKSKEKAKIDPCLIELGIMRCEAVTHDMPTTGHLTAGSSSRTGFKKMISLKLDDSSAHYLFRFVTHNKQDVSFKIVGKRDGSLNDFPLPTVNFQVEELGHAGNSFRRMRQQKMVSGGNQDGVEFVHFAENVAEK